MRRGHFWSIAWALVAVTVGLALTVTTKVDAATFIYDAAPITRVDVHSFDAASLSIGAQGTSTTLLALNIATEAESGLLDGAVCSFDPDTQVLMADGTMKSIKDVAIGDSVEAADPSTGQDRGGRAVTALHRHYDDDLIDITVTGRDGKPHVIHTTFRHPFWEGTSQSWVPAGHLLPGQELLSVDGRDVVIAEVQDRSGQSEMLNLTVGGLHTFYVRIGTDAVLVHNTCGIPDPEGRLESHVGPLHTVAGGADSAVKSVFSSGEDLVNLKDAAAGIPVVENSGFGFRVLDAGRSIGIDVTTGQPTSWYTVVTYGNGNLNTMYPGTPKWWGAP